MLLILQTLVLLTIQTPFLQGESPFQLQSNTINDLNHIAAHSDLGFSENLPGRFIFDCESGHAFLSADGEGQTSASNLERLRELLRILRKKMRRIRHGSSISKGLAADRGGLLNIAAKGPFVESPFGSAYFQNADSFTRTDPWVSNRFVIDPIIPRPDQSQNWPSYPMASQWAKPSKRFQSLSEGPFSVHWWRRG